MKPSFLLELVVLASYVSHASSISSSDSSPALSSSSSTSSPSSSSKLFRIHNSSEFIEFSNAVNTGASFLGTTVLLENDLEFPEAADGFEPIGNNSEHPFTGTFDGQGYVIRGLTISPADSFHIGLFGYSTGTTIRNVVLTPTCSVESKIDTDHNVTVSGVIAVCNAKDATCSIRNIVNLGDATFVGNINKQYLIMSGIVGICAEKSAFFRCIIQNCASYGAVRNTGRSYNAYIGGILGYGEGSSSHRCIVQNCLTYGPIHHVGEITNVMRLGGIAGYVCKKGWIDNCVFDGTMTLEQIPPPEDPHAGPIVGSIKTSTVIDCYWSEKHRMENPVGSMENSYIVGCSQYDKDYLLDPRSSKDKKKTELMRVLNARASNYSHREYLYWRRIDPGAAVEFRIVNRVPQKLFSTDAAILMLPSLANLGNNEFKGWYEDQNCTMSSSNFVFDENATLYSKWVVNPNNYTITFETRGGDPLPVEHLKLGDKITLPRAERPKYVIEWWEDEFGDEASWDFVMPARNVVLSAVWACVRIQTVEDFVDFTKVVGSGVNYNGQTVYLDADIDFAEVKDINTVGLSFDSCFLGTFDGQGHVISNLDIPTLYNYTALFGMSLGLTLRNVILDSTCVTRSTSSSAYIVGSLLGYCKASYGPCVVENCVSMAYISFEKTTKSVFSTAYVGGLVGLMENDGYASTVRNCAVYSAAVCGSSEISRIFIGGVIGACLGSTSHYCYVHNNLYAGTVEQYARANKNSGPYNPSQVIAGGIVGCDSFTEYRNCANIGNVSLSNLDTGYVGGITGYMKLMSTVSHCFWVKSSVFNDMYGVSDYSFFTKASTCFDPETLKLCKTVTVGTRSTTYLLESLNLYAKKYYIHDNFSYWLSNNNMSTVSFAIEGRNGSYVSVNKRLILTPDLVSSSRTRLDGWYTDPEYKALLDTHELTNDTTLHARWENDTGTYTISFDTQSRRATVSVGKIIARYMDVVNLPQDLVAANASDTCVFLGWLNEYKVFVPNRFVVPAKDVTLYASWFCTHITDPNEFYELSRVVNAIPNLVSFNTTIYLDADIDFAGFKVKVPPIGWYAEYDDDYYFKGTFDGQGHTISNIMMASNEIAAGIFGYSFHGLTVRNLVLDASCDIESISVASTARIGSIVGYCIAGKVSCSVLNCVNMASVGFTNNAAGDKANVGGLVGHCGAYFNECVIHNSVNYGPVEYYGRHGISSVGGLIGQSYSYTSENRCRISNSANYGSIDLKSYSSAYAFAGGIVGYAKRYNHISNCVSVGFITCAGDAYTEVSGTVAGYLQKSEVRRCFSQAAREAVYPLYGSLDESNITLSGFFRNTSFTVNGTGDLILDELNSNGIREGSSWWALNRNSSTVTFMLNRLHYLTATSQVVLIPAIDHDSSMVFRGWFLDNESMIPFTDTEFREDTTLWGYFEPTPVSRSSLLILIVIVSASVVVFVVIFVIVCIVGRRMYRKSQENKAIRELIKPLLSEHFSNSLNYMEGLYPENYARPSMKVALINAGFSAEMAETIARRCYVHAEGLRDKNVFDEGVTVDDAAAIALYTTDIGASGDISDYDGDDVDIGKSPYMIINSALAAGTKEALEPVKDILYFVMVALRKLPIVYGKPLYRGICSKFVHSMDYSVNVSVHGSINTDMDPNATLPKVLERKRKTMISYVNVGDLKVAYPEGGETMWRAISSTSPDISVTKAFLAKSFAAGKAEGTLFIIEGGWGYNVQPYSMFPNEEEIVLEPERLFKVTSIIPGEGLTVIRLEMLKTPLVLLDVFGEKKLSLF